MCLTSVQRVDGRLLDVLRRIEIRLTDSEADDIRPSRIEGLDLGIQRERR